MENKNKSITGGKTIDFRIKQIYEVGVLLELDDDVEVREVYSNDFLQQFIDHINETDDNELKDCGDRFFVQQVLPEYEKSYCHEVGVPVWNDLLNDYDDTSIPEDDYEVYKTGGTVFRVSHSDDGTLSFGKVEDEN